MRVVVFLLFIFVFISICVDIFHIPEVLGSVRKVKILELPGITILFAIFIFEFFCGVFGIYY